MQIIHGSTLYTAQCGTLCQGPGWAQSWLFAWSVTQLARCRAHGGHSINTCGRNGWKRTKRLEVSFKPSRNPTFLNFLTSGSPMVTQYGTCPLDKGNVREEAALAQGHMKWVLPSQKMAVNRVQTGGPDPDPDPPPSPVTPHASEATRRPSGRGWGTPSGPPHSSETAPPLSVLGVTAELRLRKAS